MSWVLFARENSNLNNNQLKKTPYRPSLEVTSSLWNVLVRISRCHEHPAPEVKSMPTLLCFKIVYQPTELLSNLFTRERFLRKSAFSLFLRFHINHSFAALFTARGIFVFCSCLTSCACLHFTRLFWNHTFI